MIFVYKDRIIQIEWSIFRGTSQVPEDFSRALVKLFLVGNYEKYAVPVTAEGGTLVAQLPQDLPDGAYSLEAIWVKNYNNLFPVRGTDTPSVGVKDIRYPIACHSSYGMMHPWDHRSNDRCLMRSRKDYVFAVTSYPGEETAVNQDGYVTIKISSAVATYGYDGLSAYEIAVMRGDFNGTEKDFLAKNIINNPDNEDLAIAKEGGYDVIKFADKEYNALNHSGLGRVYLRKNIVSSINKNILTQDMIKKTNTRYIIQYDYDLNEKTITIPEGCVLQFEGGSLSNGTLVGNNTNIIATNKIFNSVIINGTYNISNIYLSWFDTSRDQDSLESLINCINLSNGSVITTVNLDKEISIKLTSSKTYVPVFSNSIIKGGIIHLITDNLSTTYCIFETRYGNDNIIFDGLVLYGDGKTNNNNSNPGIQYGHGIRINGGTNIIIQNCRMYEFFGDGINLQVMSAGIPEYFPENIKIDKCTCNNNRRLGIAVEGGKNIIISNTECSKNGFINTSVYPGSGIDVEPWHESNYVENLIITDCNLKGNRAYSLCLYNSQENNTDIIVSNTYLDYLLTKNGLSIRNVIRGCSIAKGVLCRNSNLIFDNCSINGTLDFIEENIGINVHLKYCDININKADYSYNNYSAITIRNINNTPLVTDNNNITFDNCNITVRNNVDTTKAYRLFSKVRGSSGNAFIKLYNTNIITEINFNIIDYVDLFYGCNLKNIHFSLKSKETDKPLILRKCNLVFDLLFIGGTSKDYTHIIDPYDVVLDQCSFNEEDIYTEDKSIDDYFGLDYITLDHSFKVLIKDPIFPTGTVYNANALLVNKYYTIKWLLKDRNFDTNNIDGTLISKVNII